jgi:hypothetical protein
LVFGGGWWWLAYLFLVFARFPLLFFFFFAALLGTLRLRLRGAIPLVTRQDAREVRDGQAEEGAVFVPARTQLRKLGMSRRDVVHQVVMVVVAGGP